MKRILHATPRSSRTLPRSSRTPPMQCLEEWAFVHLRKQSFWRLFAQVNEEFPMYPSKGGFIIAPHAANEYIDLYFDAYEQANNVPDHAEF